MSNTHLAADEIERYAENELAPARRAEIEQHLAACAACHARVARDNRMNVALRALPREPSPRDLAARIEARAAQEQARHARAPFIALATFFSLLLALWFCLELGIAFQENGVLDFWAVLTSYSDLLSADWLNTLIALLEAVPLTEVVLTLCALLTVGVLAQQLVDSLRPRAMQFK
jgi:anti-sigma factor RsiW